MIQLKDLIQNIAEKDMAIQTCAAKVVAINVPQNAIHSPEDAFTVNVIRPDGAMIKNVRLKASIQEEEQGVISIPKVDSWVLVSIIDNVETRAFISQCSEVERTFVRFKNDSNQYLEIDSNANQFHVLFKEALPTIPGQAPTDFNAIAKIEFNSLASQNTGDHPSLITTFYDDNGKLLSETLATGQQQKTVLNSIQNEAPVARVCFDLDTTSDSKATLHFTDADGASKQKIEVTELGTTIAINEDVTVVNLLENELTVTTDQGNGYSASIKTDEVLFNKDGLNFKLDDKFTLKNDVTDLRAELDALLSAIQALTVTTPVGPSGPPINIADFIQVQNNINQLLKS
ncbi:MAG: hypothetical protein ACI9Y7_000247 [Dokdonia sp.]|jgi:hypothetical protein